MHVAAVRDGATQNGRRIESRRSASASEIFVALRSPPESTTASWSTAAGVRFGGADVASPEEWLTDEGTRQDAELEGCNEWPTVDGQRDEARFSDCVAQLSSADQRGVCLPASVGVCPGSEQVEALDPCEARNQ